MIPREVLRQVRRLRLVSRRAARVGPGTQTRRAAPGAGLAFEEVRAYSPGDEVRAIDWHVTARAGSPFVKRYAEERELTLLILADRGASMRFGTGRLTKAQVAAELGAVLALAAAARGDRVALAGADGRSPPPARGTPAAARAARDLLASTRRGEKVPLAVALARLGGRRVPRAVLAVLSDFRDAPEGAFARGFRRAAGRHDLLCVRVADPRELALPDAGLLAFADPGGRQLVVDTGDAEVRSEFARRAAAARERFAQFAAGCGASLADCSTDGGHFDALAAHLARRAGATR